MSFQLEFLVPKFKLKRKFVHFKSTAAGVSDLKVEVEFFRPKNVKYSVNQTMLNFCDSLDNNNFCPVEAGVSVTYMGTLRTPWFEELHVKERMRLIVRLKDKNSGKLIFKSKLPITVINSWDNDVLLKKVKIFP